MKKLFLACAIALGVASTTVAENYMNVYGGYAGTSLKAKGAKAETLNGFEVGYTYGLGLGEESPMAVEFGVNLGYVSKSDDGLKWKQFNVKVPVNFTYKFKLGETFAIAPYAGINFRFNPMHKITVTDYDDEEDEYYEVSTSKGLKKFQMGWQVGAKAYVKQFFVYGQFGTDFISPVDKKYWGKINDRNFSVGVGYQF